MATHKKQERTLFNLPNRKKAGRLTPAEQKAVLELVETQNVSIEVPKSQQRPTSELPLFRKENQTKLF